MRTIKYAADEGSSCEYCGADAVHHIEGTNVCDDGHCKYMDWTEDHE